jgi:hypothetical protein
MTGFFLKKAFFDGWDNILTLGVLNIGFVALVVLFLGAPRIAGGSVPLALLLFVAAIFLFFFYSGGVSLYLSEYVFDRSRELRELPGCIARTWRISAVLAAITSVQFVVLTIGFPFYVSLGGVLGLTALAVLFWVSVIWWLIMQWVFPVAAQLDDSIKKQLKKAVILFFDNTGFSIFLGLYTLFNFLVSIPLAFLIPGVSGILYSHQLALKLRMVKYDYLEEHGQAKSIPWEELLEDEEDKMGRRSLRGMIFPWKD